MMAKKNESSSSHQKPVPKKKTAVGQKKVSTYKRAAKKHVSFKVGIAIIFLIVFFAFLGVLFYTLIFFPRNLSCLIREDLVRLYSPEAVEEKEGIFLLKLKSRPSSRLQQVVYDEIFDYYGIETLFERAGGVEDRGINKLEFYRGKERFKEVGEVYIYWNVEEERSSVSKGGKKTGALKEAEMALTQKKGGETSLEKKEETRKNSLSRKKTAQKSEKTEGRLASQTEKGDQKKKPTSLEKSPDLQIVVQKPKPAIDKTPTEKKAKIVLVVDDAGYNYLSASQFYNLDLPLTFALIPGLSNSDAHYQYILSKGFDVILHVPMEPEKGKEYVEKEAILVNMTDEAIVGLLYRFIERYPKAIGMNNHMGSKAVKDPRVIGNVMKVMKRQNIFWLDSKTTPKSVAGKVAQERGVRYFERDVFLDNENSVEYATQAMNELIRIAKIRGYAIGIGHVQSGRLCEVFKSYYQKRAELGIEFIYLKDLL